jgi:DNA-binding XRE family transcriptional regulator
VWARIKEALRDQGLPPTQVQCAKLIGIEQPSVSDWNKPGKGPELENALALATKLNICVEWLYTERGPKRPGVPEDQYARGLWDIWPRLEEDLKRDLLGLARLKASPTPTSPFGDDPTPDTQAPQRSASRI